VIRPRKGAEQLYPLPTNKLGVSPIDGELKQWYVVLRGPGRYDLRRVILTSFMQGTSFELPPLHDDCQTSTYGDELEHAEPVSRRVGIYTQPDRT
jgi:hypothetical protein